MSVPFKARIPCENHGRRAAAAVLAAALLAVVSAWPARAAQVTFLFRPTGEARTVTVAGTFNDWNSTANAMTDADGDGVWTTALDVPAGRQMYKFVVNGTDWHEDRTASELVDDGFGGFNSVMEVGDAPIVVGATGDGERGTVEDPRTEITFRYRAEGTPPNAVSVAGSFNGWDAGANVLSDADGDRVWEGAVRLDPGRYAYQFILDGREWQSCDASVEHEADGFGGRRAVLEVGEQPLVVEGPAR